MKLRISRIQLLKILLFILVFVVITTFLVFLLVRVKEVSKTNTALVQLKEENPMLGMIDHCFQLLYEADNSFKYYALSDCKIRSN